MIFQSIFGDIANPYQGTYKNDIKSGSFGLIFFLNNIVKLVFIIGGLFVFFNLVTAGFQFMNAGGDPKQIEQAWNKIWQSLVGLFIMVVSFVITALAGLVLFGDPTWILKPAIYGPN